MYKEMTRLVDELATCPFTTEALSDLIGKIQAAVSYGLPCISYPAKNTTQIDQLNLEGYANLDNWVAELDSRIEGILLVRLTHVIQLWCTEFDRTEDDEPRREVGVIRDATMKKRAERRKDEKVGLALSCMREALTGFGQAIEGNLTLKPIVHEIRIQNQVIFLDPPIEYARDIWIRQLHSWLGKLV